MHHACEECHKFVNDCGRLYPVTMMPQSKRGGLLWLCRSCREVRSCGWDWKKAEKAKRINPFQ